MLHSLHLYFISLIEVAKETVSVQTELTELSVNKQDASVQFNYLIPSNGIFNHTWIVFKYLTFRCF